MRRGLQTRCSSQDSALEYPARSRSRPRVGMRTHNFDQRPNAMIVLLILPRVNVPVHAGIAASQAAPSGGCELSPSITSIAVLMRHLANALKFLNLIQ